jgi:hypothetical protein
MANMNIGYRDYADVCDSAARSGLCCRNCYGSGPRINGYCIDCLHECKQCDCVDKTGPEHGE